MTNVHSSTKLHDSHNIDDIPFQSNKCQIGRLMMFLGSSAMIFPMASLATLIGFNDTIASKEIDLLILIANVFVIIFGISSIITFFVGMGPAYMNSFPEWFDGHRKGSFIPNADNPAAQEIKLLVL